MNQKIYNKIILIIEIILTTVIIFSLWYKIYLPELYYCYIIIITSIIIIKIIFNYQSKYILISLFIIYFLIRNIYNLNMNYQIIPFGDANWDYGLLKTFTNKNYIELIQEPRILSLYSGWPIIHIISMILFLISGLSEFYITFILSSIFGFTTLIFVYVIYKKIIKNFNSDTSIIYLGLLIYIVSPESIFWQMQFVRQNLGILIMTIILYLILKYFKNPHSLKNNLLILFFSIISVMVHSVSSVVIFLYLTLLVIINTLNRKILSKITKKKSLLSINTNFLTLTCFIMFTFLFYWWNRLGLIVFPYISSIMERIYELITLSFRIEILPKSAIYPDLITPKYVMNLILIRDILIYVPSILGFIIINLKLKKIREKYFILTSSISLGTIFIINYFFFRIEFSRIISLSLLLIAFLNSYSLYNLKLKRKSIWYKLYIIFVISIIVPSSFIGIWGHKFAPIHLYNPYVNPIKIGERNKDVMRLEDFTRKLTIKNFDSIFADDINPLLYILEPDDYIKINRLPVIDIQKLGSRTKLGRVAIFIMKNLNIYFYHAGLYSPIDNPKNINKTQHLLKQQIENNFNCVYNDGNNKIWTSLP